MKNKEPHKLSEIAQQYKITDEEVDKMNAKIEYETDFLVGFYKYINKNFTQNTPEQIRKHAKNYVCILSLGKSLTKL
jgi:hypothetical protein